MLTFIHGQKGKVGRHTPEGYPVDRYAAPAPLNGAPIDRGLRGPKKDSKLHKQDSVVRPARKGGSH